MKNNLHITLDFTAQRVDNSSLLRVMKFYLRNPTFLIILILSFSTPTAHGDFETPFVDANAGSTVTGICYLLDGGEKGKFMALVSSDTEEHFLVLATAQKGIVKDGQLGRLVKVKARVIQSGKSLTRIEILKVTRMKPGKAAKSTP